MHCIKGNVGTGIFAMGSAFMSSGILLGPLLTIVICIINLHCQHLLIKACVKITSKEPIEVLPSFAETVQYTMEDSESSCLQKSSSGFGVATDVFLLLAEYGYCVVYFIFVSRHLGEIAEAYNWKQDYRVILALILIPMWMTTFLGNLKILLPVSLTSNFILWLGIIFIVYYSVQDLPPISDRKLVSNPERLPMFFGIVLFAFAGITFVIPVRMEMENPDSFTKPLGELNMSTLVSLLLYLLIGFFTYWKFGDDIEGSAFLNLPQDEALAQATKILVSIGVMLSYALHMYIPFEILYPRFYRRFGPFERPNGVIYLYRSTAVLITYAIANISSNIATFISLVGAFTGAVLSMILPVICDLVMQYGELTYYVIIKNGFIIILAIAGGITGTILSIMEIIDEFTTSEE
ncbi:proton-coupled amino acid transporter-like protein CG1139 isoform X2 [Zophobas morio]